MVVLFPLLVGTTLRHLALDFQLFNAFLLGTLTLLFKYVQILQPFGVDISWALKTDPPNRTATGSLLSSQSHFFEAL